MTRRYRIAYRDWSEWTHARTWPVSVLAAAAKVVEKRQAIVVVDKVNLERWRQGDFATAWQRLAQKESP